MADLEKNCKWHFGEDLEHFNFGVGITPQRNFRKASVTGSIVRESLQNSIDAAVCYPVYVSYTKKELAINDYPSLFGLKECTDNTLLEQHFEGMKDSITENDEQNAIEYTKKLNYVKGLKERAQSSDTIPYLCISDSNTTGMEYFEEKNNGTFASFVRSLGKNDKRSKGSAGSNGVGKGAYIQLSQYNALIVSSRSETQTLFEGNMLTVSHYVGDTAYFPFAFYDNNNGKPVENGEIPDIFVRDEIGTDINIIGIDDTKWDEQVRSMVEAVLRNFWLAIHTERLVVKIEDVIIDKNTLPILLKEYFEEKPDGVQMRTLNPLPYYNIVSSEPSNKIIHRKDTLPLLGEVEFYLNKAKTGNGKILYMRESRMLIYSKIEPLYNQINGVFVCTGERGNEILKEAENEAHNEWKAKSGDSLAKQALEELNNYIKTCLEEEIGSVTNSTVDVKGLSKRLPITTEPIYDEDYDEETEFDDEGDTITETIETTDVEEIRRHKEKKETFAKVHVRKKKKVNIESQGEDFDENPEDDGPEVPSTYEPSSTPTPQNPNPNPDPFPSPTQLPPTGSIPNEEDSNGENKKTVSINSFEPLAFAKRINGEYVYDIRIKCAKEYENANIVVKIGGEAGDDTIEIKESSLGTPEGDTIKGVHLIKGITPFTLKFKENEKVSIKISAYEYKD
ncbi:MAG: hypothetical protein MJZ32_04915 [Bacteroidaceae bacterium]|nr:hypothetical protein [Bacteroidaceae bacterium]